MPSSTRECNVSGTGKISPQLSFHHAFAILVSIQIGSGIFSSPSLVDTNVPSPFAALVVWLLSGLLSWAGAASFAELGTTLPRHGGMQEHLRYIYGDAVSSVMAWIWIMAVKPSSMALQGLVLGESLGSAVGFSDSSTFTATQLRIIALGVVILIYVLNVQSTKTSARASELFTVLKLTTVTGLAFGGLIIALSQILSQHECIESDWCSKSWLKYRDVSSGTSRID
jgi:solute carrier family 7 (L-type amino acid transporter), member 9/15